MSLYQPKLKTLAVQCATLFNPISVAMVSGGSLAVLMAMGSAQAQTAAGTQSGRAQVSEEIVVSASRIVREGFTAPTPTTELGKEDLQARAAVTVANVLFELPSVKPTQTNALSAFSGGFNIANLRSLNGANSTRTLTLVDGHRFVPSNPQGQVDTNVVPAALVDRVEVVTGGASAAWGSDAVAGVTNFILKKELHGFVGSVQYGQSQRGDNKEQGFNLAWGTSFADNRGQFMVAGEYSKLSDVALQGDRDWGRTQTGLNAPGNASLRIDGVSYTRAVQSGLTLSGMNFGGVIVAGTSGAPLLTTNATTGVQTPSSPLSGIQFGPGSTVQPFVYGSNVGTAYMLGGSGVWVADRAPLAVPVERRTLFARSTFEVTPDTRVLGELSFANTQTTVNPTVNSTPNQDAALTISRNNAFVQTLPGLAPLRTILTANPAIQSFFIGRINDEFGMVRYETNTRIKRAAIGFDSDLTDTWKLNGYATHGETKYRFRIKNFVNEANLRSAIDAVVVGGAIVCNPTTVATLQAASGCIAANPFGAGSMTPAVVDYITGTLAYDVTYKQDAGGVALQGEPFSTWAGAVSTAGGLEYRKETVKADSDAVSQKSTTAFPSGGWQFSNPKPYGGSYSVKEAFFETVVPLLANLPAAKALDFNAAVRSTDYSTSGRVTSSKVGLTYKPIEDVLFRATKSRDNRAPNLFELYSVGVVRGGGVTDFGTGVAVQALNATTITNGYDKLTPELGKTTTYGVTWSPSQVKGLSASIDAYKIDLTNAIGNLGGQAVVNACYGALGAPQNTSFCQFIERDANNNIVRVIDPIINSAAGIKTKGYDVELSYRSNLSNLFANVPGRLTLRALGTRVNSFKTSNGTTQTDNAGDITVVAGTPKWRWSLSQTYQNGPFTFFLQENIVGKAKINNVFNVTNSTDIRNNDIPSVTYVNASAQYVVYDKDRGNITLFASLNNLLDKEPPVSPTAASTTMSVYNSSQFYDLVGRVFKVGVRFTY